VAFACFLPKLLGQQLGHICAGMRGKTGHQQPARPLRINTRHRYDMPGSHEVEGSSCDTRACSLV